MSQVSKTSSQLKYLCIIFPSNITTAEFFATRTAAQLRSQIHDESATWELAGETHYDSDTSTSAQQDQHRAAQSISSGSGYGGGATVEFAADADADAVADDAVAADADADAAVAELSPILWFPIVR